MAHKHSVYDTDAHFKIDSATRAITNASTGKTSLMQYDHNSERFTFELPRCIDGHDMTLCNRVRVHYINIEAKNKDNNTPGIYEVADLGISPESEDVAICSWLISQNATKYVGSLNFRLEFACIADDGTVDYAWHTKIHTGIAVDDGICNSEIIVEQYADILEQWEARIENLENDTHYYTSLSQAVADINNDSFANATSRTNAKVKVFTAYDGVLTAQLLDDVAESETISVNKSINLSLAGHSLVFTTANAYLDLVEGICSIFGNVEGSCIAKENIVANATVRMVNVSCERLMVYGCDFRMTGTSDAAATLIRVNSTNKECLFDGCEVYGAIHSTGSTEPGTVYYQTIGIQNVGASTRVIGGKWSLNTSGNNRAIMCMNIGTITAEDAEFLVEAVNHVTAVFNNDVASVGGVMKNGAIHIKNCNIKAHTAAETVFASFGIINSKANNICHVSDTTIFTDSRDFDPHEDGLGTYAVAIDNAAGATFYIDNVVAHATHSCLSNRGKMYVNGGTYTGFCHGGIYCSHGADGEAFINNAYLRDSHYEGIYQDLYAQYTQEGNCSVGGTYIGGGEEEICSNMTAYFDCCTFEGVIRAFVMRGSSGETYNTAYLSNCTFINGSWGHGIYIGSASHTVYLGEGCDYDTADSNAPERIVQTKRLYRRSTDSGENAILKHLDSLDDSDAEAVLLARLDGTITSFSNDTLTALADGAFSNCKKIASVSLTAVTVIPGYCFQNCHVLVNCYLPEVTTVRFWSFTNAVSLTRLDLPKVTSIEGQTFNGATKLTTLILRADSVCTIAANTFNSCPISSGTGYVYVPSALVDAYKADSLWATYATQIRAIEDWPDVTG